ncbi:MAG: chorismate synthase [Clostridiales bacterium]|nr:chorismate synthase [Clostridiales bacterium]
MSSTWGNMIKLSLFGTSHGPAVGFTLDALPSGQYIDLKRLRAFTLRRAPGRAAWTSERREEDEPSFLSGLKDGFTTGAPLAALIENKNADTAEYINRHNIPRPGHADFTARARYGEQAELSGGGHISGRLTAPLCLAGGIALQILEQRGIFVGGHIYAVRDIADAPYDPAGLTKERLLLAGKKDFPVNDDKAGERMRQAIAAARADGDSLGGVIECAALGLPAGLGSPLFGGVENRLAQIIFAIPALTGLEFGAGFAAAGLLGSQNNDPFVIQQGQIRTESNNHGGVLGGISSGMPLILRAAVKPTPSIAKEQRSVDVSAMKETAFTVQGRHDPCIAPRAVPCVEAAMALALLDMIMEQGL